MEKLNKLLIEIKSPYRIRNISIGDELAIIELLEYAYQQGHQDIAFILSKQATYKNYNELLSEFKTKIK